jgi:hypothetical protein
MSCLATAQNRPPVADQNPIRLATGVAVTVAKSSRTWTMVVIAAARTTIERALTAFGMYAHRSMWVVTVVARGLRLSRSWLPHHRDERRRQGGRSHPRHEP